MGSISWHRTLYKLYTNLYNYHCSQVLGLVSALYLVNPWYACRSLKWINICSFFIVEFRGKNTSSPSLWVFSLSAETYIIFHIFKVNQHTNDSLRYHNSGKQLPQKSHFKNKDKFDAETFTPKQSALWQGKFLIVSNPEGLSWLKT